MALSALIVKFSDLRKRSRPDACATAEPQEERKPMTIPQPRPRRRKPLDAGPFAPEIGSFRLHLAAEGQSAQPGGARSHRARSVRPLDSYGPYGCRIAGVACSYTYRKGYSFIITV